MPPATPPPPTWGGTTLDARRATRRRALLDAALDLAGKQGCPAVTVRSVCRAARLTDRYFYESFSSRDALLLALYDEVAGQALTALREAAPDARAAVESFLDVLTDDPRRGRVLLLEPMTDPVLGRRGADLLPVFADLVGSHLGVDPAAPDTQLTATALIGALAGLFIRWLEGTLPTDRTHLTTYCTRLLTAAPTLAHPDPLD
ncbi:TetR/AcrR family transcriptional regulator [Streptomyces sp. DSM 44917]|uniref:TetR/AcrR family transcriptional regulator n=1 Tax=Streptomyces boetiae TaxID=3075541 RepID=A0ABU2LCP8_9ACTN|nr:TetR/AcrR family transcriptional regulator [Streptomyces sp. DSM 44917]MDT0309340.1 TetR/AcrR family transcriptional regulator [Streptomyces sp. DSM 44917]